MRTFELRNRLGESYTLMQSESGFFHSVSGLGYQDETEYRRIADVYRLIEEHRAQDEIKGKVIFRNPGAQKAYQAFVKFLQVKPLTLIYSPEGINDLFYRKGTVTEVNYSETDYLQVSITFTCFTPPFKYLNLVTYAHDETITDGKIYDYEYNFTYRSAIANTVVFTDLDCAMDSPCKITISGPLTNPVWYHYLDGEKIAEGKVTANIPAGHKIVISTEDIPYSIKEYAGETLIADLYEQSDFSKERFFMLQNGTNTIVVSDDTSVETTVMVEAQVMYASV